jgi:hypothetical protein
MGVLNCARCSTLYVFKIVCSRIASVRIMVISRKFSTDRRVRCTFGRAQLPQFTVGLSTQGSCYRLLIWRSGFSHWLSASTTLIAGTFIRERFSRYSRSTRTGRYGTCPCLPKLTMNPVPEEMMTMRNLPKNIEPVSSAIYCIASRRS